MHLRLLLFIDINIEDDMIFLCHIIALTDYHVSILEAFVVEISLSKDFRTVDHVRSDLRTLEQSQFLLHVFTLGFLESVIVDGGDSWSSLEIDVQIYVVSDDGVSRYFHVREESMTPITLDSISDFISRNGYFLSDGKPRNIGEHILFIAFYARDANGFDGTHAWLACVVDVRVYDLVLGICMKYHQ